MTREEARQVEQQLTGRLLYVRLFGTARGPWLALMALSGCESAAMPTGAAVWDLPGWT